MAKHVDYFPCTCSFYDNLSSKLCSDDSSSSSSSDSSDDDHDHDDVRSSKLRRISVRDGAMKKRRHNMSSSDEFISSDSSSSSSSSSPSSSSDSSDDDDSDDDDVRPSKIRRISGRDSAVKKGVDYMSSKLSSDEFISSDLTSSDSSSSSSSSDSSSLSDTSSWSDSSDDVVDVRLSKIDEYFRPDIDITGKKVDLISYLSSNSRDFLVDKNGAKVSVKSSIQGKYVILLWLKLPVESFSDEGNTCWALQSACSSSNWSNNVQVVVIPSMSPGWEDRLDAFDSFLSGLPSCLAIPLWDSASYSCVWDIYHIMGLDSRAHYTIVLDPNQIVLQQDCSLSIIHHGADLYPFTDEQFATLKESFQELLQEKPFPLERLLGLQLSDCLSNVAGDAKITVSDLKKKLVGVYLSLSCHLLNTINQAYQDCIAKDRELEIVLVCINLVDDPQHYMASVYAALRDKGISSWWVLPYNDSTHRRLWKLCDNYDHIEKLIIVGPQGHFFDLETDCAISYDPIHDMYPYAVEPIAQQETGRLQKLTLESLLISATHDYLVTQQGNLVPVTELRGKNVLLFIANFEMGFDEIMDKMRNYWCLEIKEKCKDSNTVVVFVPLHSSELIFTKELDPRMFWLWDPTISWLISPPNHVREALIIKDTSVKGMGLGELSCIAFEEDGQFVSKDLYDLSKYMANDFPPDHLYYHVLTQYSLRFGHSIKNVDFGLRVRSIMG